VPNKTNTPLVIDANAVLAFSISLERFKPIAWRNTQTGQFGCCMQLQKLAACHTFDVFEAWHGLAMEKGFSVGASKSNDHVVMMFCDAETVNKNLFAQAARSVLFKIQAQLLACIWLAAFCGATARAVVLARFAP
jgi:hypothetical protein